MVRCIAAFAGVTVAIVALGIGLVWFLLTSFPDWSGPMGPATEHMAAVDQFNRVATFLGCEGSVIDEEPVQRGVDNLVACLEQKRAERQAHDAELTLTLMEAQDEISRLRDVLGRARAAEALDARYRRNLLQEGAVPRIEAIRP